MKRYRLERLSCDLCVEEHQDGEWVKWEDVQHLVEADAKLKEAEDQLQAFHAFYGKCKPLS